MKYGQPLLTTSLSGALGGVVGATARGGVGYFRRRVDGSNPQSPAQAIARSIIASLSGAWLSTLTAGQRTSWAAKAAANESGIDVFVRANFQQLMAGVASVASPPASVTLDDTPISTVGTYSIGGEGLTITLPAGTQTSYNAYVTKPQSASRLSRQFAFQYATTETAGSAEIGLSASEGQLAGITVGQVFYVRLVAFGDATPKLGRVGQQQIFRVVAAA